LSPLSARVCSFVTFSFGNICRLHEIRPLEPGWLQAEMKQVARMAAKAGIRHYTVTDAGKTQIAAGG
jgi:hypothetical protein